MRRLAIAAAFAGLFQLLPASAEAQTGPALFDPNDFGKIVIQPRQSAGGGIVFEQAFGDYQNEPIIQYGENSPAVRLGRPIGRLDILFEDGTTGFCTAFIVDDQHILTNHHCAPGMDGDPSGAHSGVQAAQFVAGFIKPGHSANVDRFTVSPQIVETNRELDYTVMRVFGNPSTKYGKMELAAADPEDAEFLWIIGHPQGQSQHISREGCAASTPAISGEGKLMHTCDTLGGNSGSPVIRLSDKRVVGLHHAGDSRSGFNMAIPMTRILPQSRVLVDAAGGAPARVVAAAPQPTPAPVPRAPAQEPVSESVPRTASACTALWREAKGLGCAGYETYVADCGSHTFASMARRVIERECSLPSVAPREADAATITVKAKGGGDYASLADAVANAPEGARIEVYPGTYTQGLEIARPVEIVGVGSRDDIVLKVKDGNAIHWTAEQGRIAGITILQDGVTDPDWRYFGFHISAGSVTVENSVISSQSLAALVIRENKGATIRRSVIRDAAQGGIFMFEGGQALFEDNEIYGNALAGMEIKSGADPIVRGNTFRDGGGSGIFVNDGGKGRFENNTVYSNSLAGIELKGAVGTVLKGNVIRNGTQGGILVNEGATGRIEGNRVYANAFSGLEIKTGATPEVFGNTFRDGAQSGIYIHDGGQGVIENNEIHNNAFYGVSVAGPSQPIVRGNLFYDNAYEAIRVREGASGTYENNDLTGNRAGGFRIEEDAGNPLRRGNKE